MNLTKQFRNRSPEFLLCQWLSCTLVQTFFVVFVCIERKNKDMEIFQPIRNRLSTVGIVPYRKYPLNSRNLLTLFMLSLGAVLNCVHLLYEANTFKEFADSVCASSSMVTASIFFTIVIWKTLPLHDCMSNLEKSITIRKLQ